MDSCFAQFHKKIHKIKKKPRKGSSTSKRLTMVLWSSYIIATIHQFFFLFLFNLWKVMITCIFKAKLSDNLTLFFPGGAKFWLQNMQNSFSERGRCPLSTPHQGPAPGTFQLKWSPFPSLGLELDQIYSKLEPYIQHDFITFLNGRVYVKQVDDSQ